MITVKIYANGGRGSLHFSLKGHASSAPKGQDLVCAAATMLSLTAAEGARELYRHGKLREKPKILLESGQAEISLVPKAEDYAQAVHLLWSLQCGVQWLAREYPQYIKITPAVPAEY